MKKKLSVAVVFLTLFALVGCYQKFYCKLFRVESADAGGNRSFSHELLDGRFGTLGNSELFIRIVALWDSNNKELLSNTLYSVSVQQRADDRLTDTLAIDSVVVLLLPSGKGVVTQRMATAVMVGDFVPEPRVKTSFRDITIPEGIDSILVKVTIRQPNGVAPENVREFQIPMSRYEGTVEKFGIRPKN